MNSDKFWRWICLPIALIGSLSQINDKNYWWLVIIIAIWAVTVHTQYQYGYKISMKPTRDI